MGGRFAHAQTSIGAATAERMAVPTTNYKLTYYNHRGRAELIRLVFAQAGVAYEDVRLSEAEGEQEKDRNRYGTLPLLEVDGRILGGSGPIVRFVSERFGLAGSDEFQNAELASTMDTLQDLAVRGLVFYYEKDGAKRAKQKKDLSEKYIPRTLGLLERITTINNSEEGWIYGTSVTYVDLAVFLTLESMQTRVSRHILRGYPSLSQLKRAVEGLPCFEQWNKERPPLK